MKEKDKILSVRQINLISLRELRLQMPRYINEVARGKTFIVIKRSRPVFKIGPVL